jgi:hypothetical protein
MIIKFKEVQMELLLLGAGTAFLVYKNRKRNFEKNLNDFYISVDHGGIKGISHSIGDDYRPFITLDSAYFMPFGNHLSTTEKEDWPTSWVDVKKVIFKRLDKVYPNWQNYTKSNEENNVTSKTFTIYRSKRFRIAINCRRVDMYSVCKLPPSLHNFRFSIDKITIFCAM